MGLEAAAVYRMYPSLLRPTVNAGAYILLHESREKDLLSVRGEQPGIVKARQYSPLEQPQAPPG